jgi:hypothetical protein
MAVSTLTSTVTVNAAFLQEIKEVNHELWQLLADLRHRCQRPMAPGSCRSLVEKLCQLRDQLALHFALEEAYGYFEDPVDVAPQLCRHAALAVWLGPEFLDFDALLRKHEERENDLIFEAYDADIGVGD